MRCPLPAGGSGVENTAVSFRLRKHYLDLVTEEGTAAIAYWAALRWGPLRLRYASIDCFEPSGAVSSESAFGAAEPVERDDGVAWDASELGCTGRWRSARPAFERTLHAAGGRSVRWRCSAPAAEVSLRIGARTLVGSGYAERLDVSIEPWRLPIDTLRWGRIAERDRQATWIAWEDAERPLRLLVVDGVERAATEISDDRIAWEGGSLAFEPVRTLRDARLAEGALRGVPRLLARTPLRMLGAHETKWLSRCEGAWCIHERVRFPQRRDDER